jgi:hypothetical protein
MRPVFGRRTVPAHNMLQLFLPPYCSGLDSAEHLRNALRGDGFANHALADLDTVEHALADGLQALDAEPSRTRCMTGPKRMISMALNAILREHLFKVQAA